MEEQSNDIAQELARLHDLPGAEFARQVERIARRNDFHLLVGEKGIYVADSDHGEDFYNLLNAARKAVEHGYTVYILPNPKRIRTADFIRSVKENIVFTT